MHRALICGVGGQDGAYLARLLLEKGSNGAKASLLRGVGMFVNNIHLYAGTNLASFDAIMCAYVREGISP